ncbi:c-type cytochrome biogenesis protein CcmI [Thauera linaloolentis]|uniref:Cytochrome C biogenesis protein CcmI n=1 Tax=Thauera linaloolentis (strain DSM 12138 / JCM 21573 / CCUG 41526 / CIP 105981 / IAM 15112 / NBRC 102519 / 47Lol) TaxID=1123367 RepID=N6YXK9_THAL4|nr:c-type cytochrome biogenesis protein CcmI [Thauera linaloolentis]ENO87147.1 cytochrome C biogenesis protein CcmI [Thauera linaloolentis 47Lol = DSM 12138]MCM8566414.1 c-type cytochrome biogenesis protein CcmI [Thauera linaloolentis]
MTAFLLFAGLLLAGALLWILPPLFRAGGRAQREQAEQSSLVLAVLREQLAELDADLAAGRIDAATHAKSREEVERRALEEGEAVAERAQSADVRTERSWAVGLALSVPVLAVVGYLAFGTPDGLDPANVEGQQGFSQAEIADMVGKLETRLQQEPDNVEGWMMLARSYLVLEDFPKAAAAYEKLSKLAPGEPDVFADWADVVAAMRGTVVGDAEVLVNKALALAPDHPKALALAGTAAYQRGDYAAAAGHWEKILARIPPGEDVARGIRASVNEARAKAGLPPLVEAAAAPAAAGGPLTLSGRLEVDAALLDRLAPEDAVFVFARGEAGGPPLAALRFKAGELPRDFSFDGAALMMGDDAPLPERIIVGARVSKGGDATARSGDLEGLSAPVATDASGVSLKIDRVRP